MARANAESLRGQKGNIIMELIGLEITPEALVKYEHFDTVDDAKAALGL